MTGAEMFKIRRRLGLNAVEFAAEIGYSGNKNTLSQNIRRYENGSKAIPPWVATTVRALDADAISDVILANIGSCVDCRKIAEAIVDHLVRESDAETELRNVGAASG
jgi:hypothetical protein